MSFYLVNVSQLQESGIKLSDVFEIEGLPIKVCSGNVFQPKKNLKEKCSICLSSLKKDEDVMELECKHNYHYNCIVEWYRIAATCPLCKNKINKN